MVSPLLSLLVAAVQYNCDLVDARHAREATLCTYLLEMRDYYRWQLALPPYVPLPSAEVKAWIRAQEHYWEQLTITDYRPIPLPTDLFDPFAVEAINDQLLPCGYVYGAGIGQRQKPNFFLGTLRRREKRENLTILHIGRELARGVAAPLAMLQGDTLILRHEPLAQWLWNKIDFPRLHPEAPFHRAVAAVGAHIHDDEGRQRALSRLLPLQCELIILHEIGEQHIGTRLGASWRQRLAQPLPSAVEMLLRALRDLLADTLITLPRLAASGNWPALWLWQANHDALRRVLAPRLARIIPAHPSPALLPDIQKEAAAAHAHFIACTEQLLAAPLDELLAVARAPAAIAF